MENTPEQMLGNLLHGREKAVAITALAKEKGFDLAECYAYSDSHNDFPLLEAVGHPSAINPDAILKFARTRRRLANSRFSSAHASSSKLSVQQFLDSLPPESGWHQGRRSR